MKAHYHVWTLQTHNKSSSGVLERAADMSDDIETEVNHYVCYHGKNEALQGTSDWRRDYISSFRRNNLDNPPLTMIPFKCRNANA